MKKFKSTKLLAALLLISGFVFAATVLPNAIGANIEFIIEGPVGNLYWYLDDDWDNHKAYSGIYISGSRLANNGETIGQMVCSGGRYPIFDQDGELTHHEYVASAYAAGGEGHADAWVEVPDNGTTEDQGGAGFDPVNWNDPNVDDNMSASDSIVHSEKDTGTRSMSAEASYEAVGDARVTVGFSASGI